LDGNTLVGNTDLYVTKYDSSGARLWTKSQGFSGADSDGNAIAVNSSGSVFITGRTNGNLDGNSLSGIYDSFITKYNSSGLKQ
jgi:hypothetical protein